MTETKSEPRGAALIRQSLRSSPFVRQVGMSLQEIEQDRAVLLMPFREEVVTVGTTVHGGALASLIDTAAMAAAWATDDLPASARGTTVGLSVQFVAAALASDVRAEARVVRRGRTLVFIDVDARDAKGSLVAKGQVTYKLG
jgi:uncharacterized protein (TIGR00369 family)